MMPEIRSIASTAPPVSVWIASTRREMSSVAFAVSWARSLTSDATTAKPLPASPARAASMVAFSASRLVCSAIWVITRTTLPISADESPSLATVAFVVAASVTACAATPAASLADREISRIAEPISSVPAATVCTLRDTSSDAEASRPVWVEVSCALPAMASADADNRLDESASVRAESDNAATVCRIEAVARFTASDIIPTSSRPSAAATTVRSPSATESSTWRTLASRPDTPRPTRNAIIRANSTPTAINRMIIERVPVASSCASVLSIAACDRSSAISWSTAVFMVFSALPHRAYCSGKAVGRVTPGGAGSWNNSRLTSAL
jgi:hypothetical protein